MNIGNEIKTRRVALGLSQAELAERVEGVTQGRIGDYERGDRVPGIEVLERLAEVLGPFQVGRSRDVYHYREMFSRTGAVGAQLLARALWTKSNGQDASTAPTTELREMTRAVIREHGETVDADVALSLLE